MAEKAKKDSKGVKANMKTGTKMEIGAGVLAGAAALAAGYYFYASKDAKKHRKIVVDWANGLKSQVMTEMTKLKKLDKTSVLKMIDKATKMYSVTSSIEKADLALAAKELKGNWAALVQEIKASAVPMKAAVKKAAKSSKISVKNIVKKSPSSKSK